MALPHLEGRNRSYGGESYAPREHLGLGPGEVILFMRPDYLLSATLVTRVAQEYFVQQNLPYLVPKLEDFERHYEGINADLQSFNKEKTAKILVPVIREYRGFLDSLISAAGPQRIKLLANRSESLQDQQMDALIQEAAHRTGEYLNSSYPDVETVSLVGQTEETLYPGDLFTIYKTQRGQVTFVSPLFPESIQSGSVVCSLLAEGGIVLHAGNSMLMLDEVLSWVPKIPQVMSDLSTLKNLGFEINFIPRVRVDKQDPNKHFYVEGHIDGHAALLLGKDARPYLLLAKSYAMQDAQSQRIIAMAAKSVKATLVVVDDAHINHLAFNNLIQFPDGTVMYAPSGQYRLGKYQRTPLDVAVDQLVDKNKLLLINQLIHLPKLTKAGARCTTTIVPEAVLRALQTS